MVAAGDPIYASDVNLSAAVGTGTSTPNGMTTSTSFTQTLTSVSVVGASFVAPTSGIVAVFVKAVASNNTAGSYSIVDFEVRQGAVVGSGTVVRAATDNTAGVLQSTTVNGQGTIVSSDLITGLTAGASYNVTPVYKIAGGGSTASFNRRQAMVLPQLG